MMQVSVKTYASFTVAGIEISTNNQEAMKTIPPLWERFHQENIVAKLPSKLDESVIYGVYSQYETDEKGQYHLLAGTEVQEGTIVTAPFTILSIPLARYVVCHVKSPEALYEAWSKIWQAKINRAFTYDFERYSADGIDIYVGIQDDDQTDKAIISCF